VGKIHSEEFHHFYSSQDNIRVVKSRSTGGAVHVARVGEARNAYRMLAGMPEGERQLGRPKVGGG
jgi:hypothetical protein